MDVRTLIFILLMLHSTFGQDRRLSIDISTDNSFNISVSGKQWFRSGPAVKVRNNGAWLNSTDGSLILNRTHNSSGEDILGAFHYTGYEYRDKSGEFLFNTFIKTYEKIQVAVFGQKFVSGAEKTATDSADDLISVYPTFLVEESPDVQRGYMTFEGSSECIEFVYTECIVVKCMTINNRIVSTAGHRPC